MNTSSDSMDSGTKPVGTNPNPIDESVNSRTRQALWQQGMWSENPALVKLLGLCPLLAVSNNAVNGLGLGIATLITLIVANCLTSLLRPILMSSIRIPIYVLIIAATVTILELVIKALLPGLHASLGIFLPLIVTNCLIIGRSESFASRQPVAESLHDALAMGIGFLWVLVLLGGVRELLGQGTLLDEAHILFGPQAESWTLYFFNADNGILLALLPPGAFITLGLMLAGKNKLDEAFSSKQGTTR